MSMDLEQPSMIMSDTVANTEQQPTIEERRERIKQIDEAIAQLALERTIESRAIGKERMASGGTRVVHSKEYEVIKRYSSVLGDEGRQIALALLALGRGKLGHQIRNDEM